MYKPFPDLVLKAMEGFHIEEMVFVDPPALEPALTLKEVGFRIYTIHTDAFYYRLFRSFIGGNYRKLNWRSLSDLLTPLTRATSSADENDAINAALRTAWDDLPAPEQGVALWLIDRLLIWNREHRKEPARFPRITRGFLEDLIRCGEAFLRDSKMPHLSLNITREGDLSYIPGDGAMAFCGQIETFEQVRGAIAAHGLARFEKRLDFKGLEKHFSLVPVWLVLGLGSPQKVKTVASWMENRRKRVHTTQIYREEDGSTHFLVVGWN